MDEVAGTALNPHRRKDCPLDMAEGLIKAHHVSGLGLDERNK